MKFEEWLFSESGADQIKDWVRKMYEESTTTHGHRTTTISMELEGPSLELTLIWPRTNTVVASPNADNRTQTIDLNQLPGRFGPGNDGM